MAHFWLWKMGAFGESLVFQEKHPELRKGLPAKSKRGREEGDGTENVINCRKLSQVVVTFYDEFFLWRFMSREQRDGNCHKMSQLGCRKWGCNKWGLKGCLAALPGNRPKSAFFALFLPCSPFSGGCEEHLGNPENGGKRPFSSDILRFA